jgi:hypothetical protein
VPAQFWAVIWYDSILLAEELTGLTQKSRHNRQVEFGDISDSGLATPAYPSFPETNSQFPEANSIVLEPYRIPPRRQIATPLAVFLRKELTQ